MMSDRHRWAAVILHDCWNWHPAMIAAAICSSAAQVEEVVAEHRAAAIARAHANFLASLPPCRRETVTVEAGSYWSAPDVRAA